MPHVFPRGVSTQMALWWPQKLMIYSHWEALRLPYADEWLSVRQSEINVLVKNGTLTLVIDLPAGCKAVKSQWVFKRNADGRFRVRFVAFGFTHIQGLNYDETFSPVA
jgi:Reverse transcriptase (RNA-dependent DNA polymerase)